MATDYADWGGLDALQQFLTSLNLAVQSDQATAAAIGSAVGTAVGDLNLAVQADQATAAQIASAISGLGLATASLQATATQIADELAAVGIPLLGNPAAIYSNTNNLNVPAAAAGQVIAPDAGGSVVSMGNYLSYDLFTDPACNAASTAPFLTFDLWWYLDSGGNFLSYAERWTVPTGTANEPYTLGTGPVRGAYLKVSVSNEDATYAQTIGKFKLYGNSRPAPEPVSDWQTVFNAATIPGFTHAAAGDTRDGLVGYWTGTLAASGTVKLIAGLKFGQLFLGVIASGTSPALLVQPQAYIHGNGLLDTGQSATYNANPGSLYVNNPRSPAVLALTNTNASNSVTYTIALVAVKTG